MVSDVRLNTALESVAYLHLVHFELKVESLLLRGHTGLKSVLQATLARHDRILDCLSLGLGLEKHELGLLLLKLGERGVFGRGRHGHTDRIIRIVREFLLVSKARRELNMRGWELTTDGGSLGGVVCSVGYGSWAASAQTSEKRGTMSRHGCIE